MIGQHTQPDQETRANQAVELDTVLRRYVADPTASWGLGTYGAVAEFHRTSDEPASIDPGATLQVVTARGALRIGSTQEIRVCAYEQPGHASESWSHVLTLCLPAASSAMHRRTVLTECGPDDEALRPQDRTAVLFDLGLGTEQVDVCVRTADPEALAQLRAGLGRSLFALTTRSCRPCHGSVRTGSRLPFRAARGLSAHSGTWRDTARRTAYTCAPAPPPSPAPASCDRAHSDGWVPCLSLYPANPVYDALGHPGPSRPRGV
jgi:hypothetical protein